MGSKKADSVFACIYGGGFPVPGSVRAQVPGTEMLKTHVATEFLEPRDLLKCSAAANGNNTHSKEIAQRITSIFVQHD